MGAMIVLGTLTLPGSERCVADDGAGGEVPHVRDEPFAENGRGIVIVTALAAEWGVEAEHDGTTTWFRLRG